MYTLPNAWNDPKNIRKRAHPIYLLVYMMIRKNTFPLIWKNYKFMGHTYPGKWRIPMKWKMSISVQIKWTPGAPPHTFSGKGKGEGGVPGVHFIWTSISVWLLYEINSHHATDHLDNHRGEGEGVRGPGDHLDNHRACSSSDNGIICVKLNCEKITPKVFRKQRDYWFIN